MELVAEGRDLPELLARAAGEERHRPQELDLGVAAELHDVGSYETERAPTAGSARAPRARLPTQTHASQPTATAPTIGQ